MCLKITDILIYSQALHSISIWNLPGKTQGLPLMFKTLTLKHSLKSWIAMGSI